MLERNPHLTIDDTDEIPVEYIHVLCVLRDMGYGEKTTSELVEMRQADQALAQEVQRRFEERIAIFDYLLS